jgi:hypothetical protein
MVISLSNSATCGECGAERSPELATESPRTPCANCDATAITVHVSAFESFVAMDSFASVKMTPGDQGRGWKRRWQEAERELAGFLAPRPGPLSPEAVHAAHHQLQGFYVQLFHLSDALKLDPTAGVADLVEPAMQNDPVLSLLRDLATLDKHFQLHSQPWSGDRPRIGKISGTSAAMPSGLWRLNVRINHGGRILDGLDFARQAVDAWRRLLQSWHLI